MPNMTASEAARFLRESGLLFEINRTILHPLGLALAINGPSTEDPKAKLPTLLFGFAGIHDVHEEEPEGMVFGPETEGPGKLKAFYEKEGIARMRARFKALGFVVQPLPDGMYAAPSPAGEHGMTEEEMRVSIQAHGGEQQLHHRIARGDLLTRADRMDILERAIWTLQKQDYPVDQLQALLDQDREVEQAARAIKTE